MRIGPVLLAAGLGLLVAAPLALRGAAPSAGDAAPQLVILSPHREAIRAEFARGFDRWHRELHGEGVRIAWATPGGATRIRRMLEAQWTAALRDGREPGGGADLVFGGGADLHERLKAPIVAEADGRVRRASISVPVGLEPAWLEAIYGPNTVGGAPLYDPDRHWFGTALAGFGLVVNRERLALLGVPTPADVADLADPALRGWVALADPSHSGAMRRSVEILLQRSGWDDGWRMLRRIGANARSIHAASSRVPTDVGRGDAAAGVCIDFYGRFEAEALARTNAGGRLAYIAAPGLGAVDVDPVSVLRNAPQPDLARRFVEFCLSEAGQTLWCLPPGDPAGDGLGPTRRALHRLPARRIVYDVHFDRFVDPVNPYARTPSLAPPRPELARLAAPVFGAMVVDNRELLTAAWAAIAAHPAFDPAADAGGDAAGGDPRLAEMIERFDAMPTLAGPDGRRLPLTGDGPLADIERGWLRGGWRSLGLWPAEAEPAAAMRRRLAEFFRDNYRGVLRLAETPAARSRAHR
ncbi:MAG: ABC transporter substrate-binding protein [Planctomycetota bacterium]|jgi:hypothetical protein